MDARVISFPANVPAPGLPAARIDPVGSALV